MDVTLNLDFLDWKDYRPGNNRGFGKVLIANAVFSKIGWTTLLKIENTQTMKDSFENIPRSSDRKPILIQTENEKKLLPKTLKTC